MKCCRELKILPQTDDNISVKWQRVCGVERDPLPSLCPVGGLIDGLSTVFVDSLYSIVKPFKFPYYVRVTYIKLAQIVNSDFTNAAKPLVV